MEASLKWRRQRLRRHARKSFARFATRASARGLSLTREKRTAGTAGRRGAKPSRASKRCSALALSFGRRLRTTTSRRGTLRRASGWPLHPIAIWARALGSVRTLPGDRSSRRTPPAPRKPGGLLTESENAPRRSPVRDPLGAWSSPQPFLRASCASGFDPGRLKFCPSPDQPARHSAVPSALRIGHRHESRRTGAGWCFSALSTAAGKTPASSRRGFSGR